MHLLCQCKVLQTQVTTAVKTAVKASGFKISKTFLGRALSSGRAGAEWDLEQWEVMIGTTARFFLLGDIRHPKNNSWKAIWRQAQKLVTGVTAQVCHIQLSGETNWHVATCDPPYWRLLTILLSKNTYFIKINIKKKYSNPLSYKLQSML